jgi:hypothetical protein
MHLLIIYPGTKLSSHISHQPNSPQVLLLFAKSWKSAIPLMMLQVRNMRAYWKRSGRAWLGYRKRSVAVLLISVLNG